MAKHYAKTEILRAGVSQEARVVYTADGPEGTYCQVQVLPPSDVLILAFIDQEPKDIGPDRSYKGAPVNVSFNRIDLLPGQFLTLAADDGFGVCALIVHHLYEE